MLVVMAGLPGTGKSTLARALADQLNGVVLDKDRVRAALFPPAEIDHSTEQDGLCIGAMLDAAHYLLRKDSSRYVFIDGRTFSKRAHIETVIHAASPWHIIECVCSEETARKRLEADALAGTHPAGNRDFALYLKVKRAWQPIDLPHTVIDTDTALNACVARALRGIVGQAPTPAAASQAAHVAGELTDETG